MSNVLSEEKQQQVIVLGKLGWSLRRIEQQTGVRRETASAYLKAAGIGVRGPGRWGRGGPASPTQESSSDSTAAKPANEVTISVIMSGFDYFLKIGGIINTIKAKRMIGERFGGLDEGLVSRDRRAIREKIETEPKVRKWFQDLVKLSTQVMI